MKHHAFVLAGLLAATAGGPSSCHHAQFVHTVVHEDGSVDRAIVQDVALTPESARRPQLWLESRLVKAAPDDFWDGSIAGLPASQKPEETTYFAARGHFASVGAVPDHYAEMAKDGVAASRLQRAYATRDFGFVVERAWTETLTDIVNPEQMAEARAELSQINVALLRAALREGLGTDYVYEPFVAWTGTTTEAFFATLSDSGLEARAANDPNAWSDSAMRAVTLRVAERHGVPWMAADDSVDMRSQEVISGQARTLIVRRDGRPLDATVVDLVTAAIMNVGDKALVSFDKEGGTRFQAGLEKEAAARYGGMDALDRRAAILYQRMFGITPFDGERRFDVSLTLPGTIVDANGTLETESRVRWSFRLQEAFAFGNAMRCRSLAPDLAAQRAVLGSARLTSREGMLRYASMVEGDDELLKVVRQAIAEKRAAPIEAYHSKLAADQKQADRAAKVAKLMALLGVTVK